LDLKYEVIGVKKTDRGLLSISERIGLIIPTYRVVELERNRSILGTRINLVGEIRKINKKLRRNIKEEKKVRGRVSKREAIKRKDLRVKDI